MDFYQAALKVAPGNAAVLNKIGISQLMMQRDKEAKKSFERAIKADRNHADAYNNLCVAYYALRNYNAAIKQYQKAISLKDDAGSYYNNLGAAYFAKKKFDKAIQNYSKAVQLDPDIFERTSHAGVAGEAYFSRRPSPLRLRSGQAVRQDRLAERSLHYLKKAMEEGYKDIKNVYKDDEFSTLRKDPRFAELMAAKTLAIPD